jgi:polynucleotide 5'-kinase involved in rRNA processing
LLDGLGRLQKLAHAAHATAVVVDTTGMIAEQIGGGGLKAQKIELLQPHTVIALQREGELDHILVPLKTTPRINIYEFNPVESVVRKSPEERARRRRARFLRYFQSAVQQQIPTDALPVYGQSQPTTMSLMAFQDKLGFALALGVVSSISTENMEILTPLSDLSRVASMLFSAHRLDPLTGEEL